MSSLFHGREKLCAEGAGGTLCRAKRWGGARASLSQPAGQQLLYPLRSKRPFPAVWRGARWLLLCCRRWGMGTAKLWSSVGGFRAHHRGRIRLGEEFVYQKAKISTCLAEAGLVSCRKAIPSKWKRTNSKVGDRRHGGCG